MIILSAKLLRDDGTVIASTAVPLSDSEVAESPPSPAVRIDEDKLDGIKRGVTTQGISAVSANDVCFLLEIIYKLEKWT